MSTPITIELPEEFQRTALLACADARELALEVLRDYIRREAWQKMEASLVEPWMGVLKSEK